MDPAAGGSRSLAVGYTMFDCRFVFLLLSN